MSSSFARSLRPVAHLLPLVFALLEIGRPAGVNELVEAVGANQETVRLWLRQLQGINPAPITRVASKKWALTPGGARMFRVLIYRLSTGIGELSTGYQQFGLEGQRNAENPRFSDGSAGESGLEKTPNAEHPRFSDGLSTDAGDLSTDCPQFDGVLSTGNADNPRFESGSQAQSEGPFISSTTTLISLSNCIGSSKSTPQNAENPRFGASLAAFERYGVQRNARVERICQMEHVSPAYIHALHYVQEKRGKGGGEWAGLLVRLAEGAEPVDRALLRMFEGDRYGADYVSGEFGQYINH